MAAIGQPRGMFNSIYNNQLPESANQDVLGGGRSKYCGSTLGLIISGGAVSETHSVADIMTSKSRDGAEMLLSDFPSARVRLPHGHSGACCLSESP